MDLFEAKSDRGLERRVDEDDLRNLYRAGYLHLDSLVRRSGSPNWFKVEEMFPHFDKINSAKKYSANFKPAPRFYGLSTGFLIVLSILVMVFLLVRFSQKIASPTSLPAQQTQPVR